MNMKHYRLLLQGQYVSHHLLGDTFPQTSPYDRDLFDINSSAVRFDDIKCATLVFCWRVYL